jgi:hypothetical protein
MSHGRLSITPVAKNRSEAVAKIGCPFVLVLVVVLDVLGFCGEKDIPSVMILFDRSDSEISAFSQYDVRVTSTIRTRNNPFCNSL